MIVENRHFIIRISVRCSTGERECWFKYEKGGNVAPVIEV
jgi:hypothetical protein